MKIFLDVGGHYGQTIRAVLTSEHLFDRIYCFEPQPFLCNIIKKINNPCVVVNEFGLWNKNCSKEIYWEGRRRIGGSIYLDKFDQEVNSVVCEFKKASDWFKNNINQDDFVVLKLNCEGSECDILEDLLDSKEFGKVDVLMVDFDVRKIPSQVYKEEEIRERIEKEGNALLFLLGGKEEKMLSKSLFNMYYNDREKWAHYWMNKVLL